MVEIKDIVDQESLEGWLRDQPKEVSVWFVWRAAMRVLPFIWDREEGLAWDRVGNSEVLEFNISQPSQHLPVLQHYLVLEVGRRMPSSKAVDLSFETSQKAASAGASDGTHTVLFACAIPAFSTSAAAARSAGDAASGAARGHFSSSTNTPLADFKKRTPATHSAIQAHVSARASAVWNSVRKDCEAIVRGQDLDRQPLWADNDNPFNDAWARLKKKLIVPIPPHPEETGSDPMAADWSFWIKWYDSVLAGEPLNGDMLEEIALIEPAEWEKGAEHINNKVIARIVEKYRLLREVQDLRKELGPVRQTATAATMGHNNPPEGIDTEAEAVVVAQTEIIWTALGEAEEELSKQEPSPSVLKRTGTAILGAIKSVLVYAGKLGDVGLKATAATVGAGVGAYLISKGPEIQSFAEQVIEFAVKYLH